jgi:hypothetical protein
MIDESVTVKAFARRAGREAASDAVKGIYRLFALVELNASRWPGDCATCRGA